MSTPIDAIKAVCKVEVPRELIRALMGSDGCAISALVDKKLFVPDTRAKYILGSQKKEDLDEALQIDTSQGNNALFFVRYIELEKLHGKVNPIQKELWEEARAVRDLYKILSGHQISLCTPDLTNIDEIREELQSRRWEFESLAFLDLHGCDITRLPREFVMFSNLEHLYLGSSKLKRFPRVIASMPKLKELDISSTFINDFNAEDLDSMKHLKRLGVGHLFRNELPASLLKMFPGKNLFMTADV